MTYKCLKCDIDFDNEDSAGEHLMKTGSYSPMTGETRLHHVVEIVE